MAGPATLDEFLRSGLERSQDERGQPSRLLRPPGLEPRADDPGDAPEDLRDPLESEHRQDAPSRWQCLRCDGLSFHWSDGWRCNGCGSYDFFNAAAPTTRQGGYGTWVYVPRGEPNDPEATSSSSSLPGMPSTWNTSPPLPWAPARRLRVPRPSPDLEAHETAESASLTSDATVDPDTLLCPSCQGGSDEQRQRRQRQRRLAAMAALDKGNVLRKYPVRIDATAQEIPHLKFRRPLRRQRRRRRAPRRATRGIAAKALLLESSTEAELLHHHPPGTTVVRISVPLTDGNAE